MTETVYIHSYNASNIKIDADMFIYQSLHDHFAYKHPNARFIPSVKNKIWDGIIRLFNIRSRTLPLGLIPRLQKFLDDVGAEADFSGYTNKSGDDTVTYEQIKEFADSLNIHSDGKKIEPHDYQLTAVYEAIKRGRMVAIAPTSAGKSLILYIYLQWFMRNPEMKMLLIVPSVALVHQMFGDFKDYSSNYELNPEDYCHLIMGGKAKQSDKPLTISTWQSLQGLAKDKTSQDYFEQWDLVAVDEVHSAKGTQLTNILGLCVNAYTRLGVTGTLDGSEIMEIGLEGIFGPIYKVITTKELMDRGAVAQIDIKCLMLTYPDEIKKQCTKLTYQEEVNYIVTNQERLKFVAKLATSLKGNTLILINFVGNHGDPLHEAIKAIAGDRKVFFIHGGVNGEERNDMKAIIEKEDDAIIVGSYGVLSTGVSIKRLHNVIFASPSKSQIRVLQSLGRGLRLGKDKSHCTLYDIGDDLSHKKHKNYTLLHAIERIKMYSSQQFNYKLIRIQMKGS